MNEATKKTVLEALVKAFPAFPVRILESPEDTATLWVRVFAVPADQVRPVKDFIHDLEDDLPIDAQVMLLPMVKNLEVTRQHYPEFLPPESTPSDAAIIERYLVETIRQPRTWETISYSAVLVGDYRPLTPQGGFDIAAIMSESLRPRRTQETAVAANNELALAA